MVGGGRPLGDSFFHSNLEGNVAQGGIGQMPLRAKG